MVEKRVNVLATIFIVLNIIGNILYAIFGKAL